ncbi:MAG: hypothetical protein J6K55_07370 [Clostridia bacterium]|nr:hypothetical protein [Clostridia bacterium]
MRLLIAMPDPDCAAAIRFQFEDEYWNTCIASGGQDAISRLKEERYDLLVLHACLPEADGFFVGKWLETQRLVCPPRVVFICPAEYYKKRPSWADAVVEAGVSMDRLCSLLHIIAKKPLPALAAAQLPFVSNAVAQFLDEIAMDSCCKGRVYTAWILEKLLPSPMLQEFSLHSLYIACARAFHVQPASVERCIRTAVENVFTQGSMQGIEHFFGATVDPEKGKPTNRAFLLQAASELRRSYSLADARSPNRSVMHHSPAAPTSV